MCQSRAQGGKRCAAHTRPAYEAAAGDLTVATSDPKGDVALARRLNRGYEAVVAYASTPSGMTDVKKDHNLLVEQYEQHPSTTAAQEMARQETLSNYRTAVTAAEHIRRAEGDTRAAIRPPSPTAKQAAQVAQERQTQAEEVIWCMNHGYTADADAELRGFNSKFGIAPAPEPEAPPLLRRPSKRKRDEALQERRDHANLVVELINSGYPADAKFEARRFAAKYDTGYNPKMADSMAEVRAARK